MKQCLLMIFFGWVCAVPSIGDDATSKKNDSVEALVKRVRQSLVTIRVTDRGGDETGLGTGFVIDADGLIATNLHVINEGRPFTVQLWPDRKLKILAVEASEAASDLAIVRVDTAGTPLPALPLAQADAIEQGAAVFAFGNPLGLEHSVVQGLVSAVREVNNTNMLQLAMPIEFGNSGGPVVDANGEVHGVINMKSAVDENLGFAIPVAEVKSLLASPNPVKFERWTRLSSLSPERWETLFGATWRQRSGIISVSGQGSGFGGRSLCLSKEPVPEIPFELSVQTRQDDVGGAAGLVFCSDGRDRHYGFYPSAGKLRLSCFRGPSVYSWQVTSRR